MVSASRMAYGIAVIGFFLGACNKDTPEASTSQVKPSVTSGDNGAKTTKYIVPKSLSIAERRRAYPKGNRKLAKKLNTAGYKRFKAKDRVGALTNYQKAVDASPAYEMARFNLACELSVAGRLDAAIEQLEHLLRMGTPLARKLVSRARYDKDFTALHSDKRYQAINAEFAIDPNVGIIAQLCADPGKVSTVVDDRRGFYYQRETETALDDGKTEKFTRHVKAKKARNTLYAFLKEGGQWCQNGQFRKTSISGERNWKLILAKQKKPYACAHRKQVMEWTSQEYLCFVREANSWFVYAASHIPDGPLSSAYERALMVGFSRAKSLGIKAYNPK